MLTGHPLQKVKNSGNGKFNLIWPQWRQGAPEWHIYDLQTYIDQGFNLNTLIYSAIAYKARALQSVKMVAYTGDPENPEKLPPSHPLSRLIARPNPNMTWRQFHAYMVAMFNLAGNAYAVVSRDGKSVDEWKLFPLRADRVYIIPVPEGKPGIVGYLYVPEGASAWSGWTPEQRRQAVNENRAVPILAEDMIHVKLPNPGDPLDGLGYGLSPLSPIAYSADVDNDVTQFLKKFFDSGAMMTGLLKFNIPLDQTTISQIKTRWKETMGGWENWDIGVLDSQGDYQRTGLTFDEMGFSELDERNETRILGPFGVPGILIGTRSGLAQATKANFEEARRQCWEDTLIPENDLFQDAYQFFLQDGEAFVKFDYSNVPALWGQSKEKLDAEYQRAQAWQLYIGNGLPKRIAAKLLQIDVTDEDVPDFDAVYMPMSLTEVGTDEPIVEPATALVTMPAPAQSAPPDESNIGAASAEDEQQTEPAAGKVQARQ